MAVSCSFSGIQSILCGESRGVSEIVDLVDCKDDVSAHLSSCHLSKSELKEYDVVLARAGLFELSHEQISKMKICSRHRNNLGKLWRPRTTCQYPTHTGPSSRCKGKHVFNLQLSQDVYKFHGNLVQIGSRKYSSYFMFQKVYIASKTRVNDLREGGR